MYEYGFGGPGIVIVSLFTRAVRRFIDTLVL